MCNVQVGYYLSTPLLMCSFIIIEPFGCLCAIRFLLNTPYYLCAWRYLLSSFFACVHFYLYRDLFLLVCKGEIIEKFLCFCAIRVLLSSSTAYVQSLTYVQKDAYWHYLLLTCNSLIIEHFLLLMCNYRIIESRFCLCAVTRLLRYDLACVQWPTY